MKPKCFNRPPYTDPNAGWVNTGNRQFSATYSGEGIARMKPVYRYRHPWFTDKCATWQGRSIGPDGARYPEAHGWDCRGCRWLPEGVL